MTRKAAFTLAAAAVFVAATLVATPFAQVGKGLLDANTAAESDLVTVPHLTPAIVNALIARRPFTSVTELNTFLLTHSLTPVEIAEVYGKTFVHVNLNTGTRDELLLIPGAGARMAREFSDDRPWKTWGQFDKEIGKSVGQQETDRLKQYVFIPVKLNSATDADILSIPGAGTQTVREFKQYRPWKTKDQFDKEIGKSVGATETSRLWRYVVIDDAARR